MSERFWLALSNSEYSLGCVDCAPDDLPVDGERDFFLVDECAELGSWFNDCWCWMLIVLGLYLIGAMLTFICYLNSLNIVSLSLGYLI